MDSDEFSKIFMDNIKKYGSVDDNGNMWIDSGLQKQKIGTIQQIENRINSFFDKTDLAKQILKIQPLYYDKYKNWWVWINNKYRWEIVDETDVLNFVNKLSTANTVNQKERNEILESLRQTSRKWKPIEIKESWIQFQNIIFDIETGEEFEASPKYFVTNPIPWKLHKERFVNTPFLDKIFEEWVGKDKVQTLYEIIAYCLIPAYPIHRIFCFIGGGMNGKSCYLNLLRNFIGKDNCCSTELDNLINSRFEVTRLHKKLVCQMGETNFNEMSKTSMLKKLSGGDLIGFEYKRKDPFEEVNFAKILIATNNLPATTDKTIGFYRRWLIIDFPNQFSEKKDILSEIPQEEYEALAVKSVGILKDLLDKREFHNEGDIETRMNKYEEKSNPIEKFIKEFCNTSDPEGRITKASFSRKLNEWLKANNYRTYSDIEINRNMKKSGFDEDRKEIDWYSDGKISKKLARVWLGIEFKQEK